jgi:proline iminopeptidase
MAWEQQLIETENGIFEVFSKGSGKPLCVAHHYTEFTSEGDLFAESFVRSHQVYLVNLRGAGLSVDATSGFELSLIDAVMDLEAIRAAIGIQTWSFAGHSTGGMIGLLYGIHFPERLDSLLLVGASGRYYGDSKTCIYNPSHHQFQCMQDLIEQLKNPELSKGERNTLSKERVKLSLHFPDKYDIYFNGAPEKLMSAKRMNMFAREYAIYDVTRRLNKITCPVWIGCGLHDVQCPIEFSLELHELISGSKFTQFNASNHYPFIEEQDLFKEELQAFIMEVKS